MRTLLTLLLLLPVLAPAQVPVAAEQYRADMTRSAYRVLGPPAPVATLAAQIHTESAWHADAVSWAGAQGLAQFMPATAQDMADRHPADCAPANPFRARWAFACRDRYMRTLLLAQRDMAGGLTECDRWAFALRSYNGGLGWINRDRRITRLAGADPDRWHTVATHNAGRSAAAFAENTAYAPRIFGLESRYISAGWGAGLRCPTTPPRHDQHPGNTPEAYDSSRANAAAGAADLCWPRTGVDL